MQAHYEVRLRTNFFFCVSQVRSNLETAKPTNSSLVIIIINKHARFHIRNPRYKETEKIKSFFFIQYNKYKMFNFTHRHTTSDVSNASKWSYESDNTSLHSLLLNEPPKQPNVKFSKVLIVNDTTTAYIMKDSLMPGSTKDVIDRYYLN